MHFPQFWCGRLLFLASLSSPLAAAAPATPSPVRATPVHTATVRATTVRAELATHSPLGAVPTEEARAVPAEDDPAVLIRAERLIVRPGHVLTNVAVLVRGGVIVAVGPDLTAPEGATEIQGAVVCAGFIDAWSSMGISTDGRDVRLRTDAATRTLNAVDPYGSAHDRDAALRAGVLAVRSQIAEGAAICGVGVVLSLGPGTALDEMVVLEDAVVAAAVGVSQSSRATDVFDRIAQVDKLVGLIRAGLDYRLDHVEYRHDLAEWQEAIAKKEKELEKDFKKAKKARAKDVEKAEETGKEFKEKKYKEDKQPKVPKFDADKEVMARVANGELPLVVTVHRVAELREFLTATRSFDRLRLVIAGGTEALAVADELAARHIPVIVWPAPLGTRRPNEFEAHDLSLAGRLAEKGVTVLLGSGGGDQARDLPLLASLAIGHGLDPETAFSALTWDAARAFDVADRLGSVQRGRRADLLVLDGEPLLSSTRVLYVLAGGRVVVSPGQ